jgi:hypothetical protein
MAKTAVNAGQHPIIREAYLEELRTNCEIAISSWRELKAEAGLGSLLSEAPGQSTLTDRNIHSIWRCTYDILEAAYRLSLVLWNTRGSRGLREELGVANSSPLKSRDVRNAMQHLEERIDSFVRTHPGMHIGGWRVTSHPRPNPRPEAAFLRFLNTFHWTLRVYDSDGFKECNIEEIMKAVSALSAKLPKSGLVEHHVFGPYFIPD